MQARWIVGVAVLLGGLGVGCGSQQVIGACQIGQCEDGGGDATLSPPACADAPPSGVASCDECRAGHCCDEVIACTGKPLCSEWLACVNGCAGDAACRQGCFLAHRAGDEKAALAACEAQACADACGLGDNGGYVPAHLSDECAACAATNCSAEETAAAQDADFLGWLDCVAACPGLQGTCVSRCGFRDEVAGAYKSTPLAVCMSRACPACNLGDQCGTWYAWNPQACEDCAVQSCCDALKPCADSVDCIYHATCAQGCRENDNQPSCFQACDASYPAGVGVDHVRWLCMSTVCGDECLFHGTDVWTCGGLPYVGDACKECSDAQCCAAASACGADAGCAQAFVCVRGCAGDAACAAACEAAAPSGAAGWLQSLRSCLVDACGAPCG